MQHETFNTENILTSESQGGVSSPYLKAGASTPLGQVTRRDRTAKRVADAVSVWRREQEGREHEWPPIKCVSARTNLSFGTVSEHMRDMRAMSRDGEK